MARYINAGDLQAQLERKKAGIANRRYTEGWNDCMMRVKSMVSKAPAADVAPVVHGRWVPFHSEVAGDIQYCSACEIGFGAKMDFCSYGERKEDAP